MFGSLVTIVSQTGEIGPPPKDVPPPTPIRLPQCNPELRGEPQPSLVRFLQQLQRPNELTEAHFAALGVHVHADAPAEEVIPDPSYLPVFSEWEGVDLDEARRRDETFRQPLCNGGKSPEARFFLECRNELSVPNQAAFRSVRRVKPEPGKQQPRLGNCYEFYKQMELMASYWDDTSLPPLVPEEDEEESPPLPPRPADGSSEQLATGAAPESNTRSEADPEAKPKKEPQRTTYRTSPGSQMPAEFRHNFISAFVKLIAYAFGCNVLPPRVEPRLQLLSPPFRKSSQPKAPFSQTASYFPSGCVFLCKAPTTREAARAGIVEGPIAAVSARNTTNFNTPADSYIDFGRELVAALITAQHRAREGQPEKRFGEGKWWATEKRWGGGEGGPIGREVDGDPVVGDKDAVALGNGEGVGASKPGSSSSSQSKGKSSPLPPIPMRGQPVSKKPRKNMSIYDSYRMVRLPSSNWDKKTKYATIGKVKGADYDDVFVLSSLFHHLSILRVRVPKKLLDVLGGELEGVVQAKVGPDGEKLRSWGKLEMWRSRWFDLFIVEERLEAMRLLWGMMGWVMRKVDEDVAMKNA
ncbi:uncharacterized protein F4807DRAFT_176918 [Annulohypoxylon truncatum]|uniref:uncharacterized protein n=1 Tax=Annulohypoxylon truncatum TaxID=327061 RepID=UPI002008B61B|nr:uncharacterized protein F4807DRAFT_176918 [Annulohypoxylon truncatum]KAI1207410.1 hypothetical protein F4807DRAFT_176918 [Annulohypoxylon truncatum]